MTIYFIFLFLSVIFFAAIFLFQRKRKDKTAEDTKSPLEERIRNRINKIKDENEDNKSEIKKNIENLERSIRNQEKDKE